MFQFYAEHFLPGLPDGYDHLEIGPGHRLLLHLASVVPRCETLTAIDVSATSLEATTRAMHSQHGHM